MIGFIIRSCLHHRLLVLLISVLLCVLGARAIQHTAVDAIPDLSDVQVIIKTSYPGQAPNWIEQHITRPSPARSHPCPAHRACGAFRFW